MSSLDDAPKPGGGTSADGAGDTGGQGPQAGWAGLSAALDRRRWVWPVLLLVGYLAQLAVRLVLTHPYDFPVVNADEPSYLVLARVLGGGTVTDVPVGSMVPGGYPLLIAPALALAGNAMTAYHLVLLTNALVNALTLPLAYLMLRRLAVPSLLAYCFASAAALLSPVVFYEQFAMADSVFGVVLLAWALGLHGLLTEGPARGRLLQGIGAGLAAGYAFASHDRGSVVVAVTALVLLGALVFRWAPRREALIAAASLGVGVLGARLLVAYLASRFRGTPASEVGTSFFKGLTDPHQLTRTVARVCGQTWYFVLSTWGIGGLGIVICVLALFTSAMPRAHRVLGAVLLATLFGIIVASAVTLPDDHRIDNLVYARYASPLVVPMFVLGAAGLARLKPRALLVRAGAVAALVLLCAGAVTALSGNGLRHGRFILWGIPDVAFLAQHWTSVEVFRSTAVGLLIFVLCVLAAVLARRAVPLLAVALAALALVSTVMITQHVVHPYVKERRVAISRLTHTGQVRADDRLVMDLNLDWETRMAQPFMVYTGRVWTVDLHGGQQPPAGATVAVLPVRAGDAPEASWPGAPAGWSVSAADPGHGYVVWRHQG